MQWNMWHARHVNPLTHFWPKTTDCTLCSANLVVQQDLYLQLKLVSKHRQRKIDVHSEHEINHCVSILNVKEISIISCSLKKVGVIAVLGTCCRERRCLREEKKTINSGWRVCDQKRHICDVSFGFLLLSTMRLANLRTEIDENPIFRHTLP